MLWDPDRHEPITDAPWSEAVAREGIRTLAARAVAAFDGALWPAHPSDGDTDRGCFYLGGAGVAWTLDQLQRRGEIAVTRDWRAERFVVEPMPSLMIGEVGAQAVADRDHDRLYALIEANIEHDSLDIIMGAPGTMLPALFLFERTGEPRWRELFVRNAEHLLRTFEHHADFDVWMWTHVIDGERVRQLGVAHGFAGAVFSLLRGAALLSTEQRVMIEHRAAHTLKATARREGELANWLPHVGTPRSGREKILVQWCHGAPGMILGLSRLPHDEEIDALFVAGAEAIWRAGPLVKGAGLCHGTAGNGYALLAMYERTGDARWLERARRFAIHALAQTGDRYSLWTGDLGVALFLADCIAGTAKLPGLDYL